MFTIARGRPRLDIGCGTRSLAAPRPRCARAHGLDISSEMIPIARSEAAAEKIDNVTFRVGPFDDSFAAFATESPPNCYDRARLQGASS
ncbi:MAG: class I SAM-dependent methyltransferase [Nannocystaceae bacterium]